MSALIWLIQLLGRVTRDCFIILGVVFFLFGALNILGVPIARPTISDPNDVFSNVDGPESAIGLQVYKRVFKTNDPTEAMARLHTSPYFSMHPRLEFITTPVNNRFFHVGLDGIRYEPGWDDRKVASLLSGQAPKVFAFGGSTMFGYSVGGDETIPYYMNKILRQKTGAVTINFGGEAYNETVELDKLIYLLKSGYRPTQVFFLDGWNDLSLSRSNMRLQDKVIFHGFVVSRGEIAFTPGTTVNQINYLKVFAESLPLYRALFERHRPISLADIKLDRNAFTDGFDFREADYIFRNWAAFSDLHREKLKAELLQFYREKS